MRRFIVNRWWTLLLALILGAVGAFGLPAAARADAGSSMIGDPTNTGGTDPTNAGDPDIPINTGKGTLKPMGSSRGAGVLGMSRMGVGDATAVQDPTAVQMVWLYKFRIALQMFRVYVLR